MAMSKKQEQAARELFGDEYMDALLAKGDEWTKELEGLGIGFKHFKSFETFWNSARVPVATKAAASAAAAYFGR